MKLITLASKLRNFIFGEKVMWLFGQVGERGKSAHGYPKLLTPANA